LNKIRVALVGNPNVGKSTVFNALTGMKQHTGNWTGKTVDLAFGTCIYDQTEIEIVDLPGTYSLKSASEEERVATNYMENGEYDVSVVVCDSVCLEKSLNLVLQTLEITNRVIVCLNLIDEASKKGIIIDSKKLENILGVPVVLTDAKSKFGLNKLLNKIVNFKENDVYKVKYSEEIELRIVNDNRYDVIKSLEEDESLKDEIVNTVINTSSLIVKQVVKFTINDFDRKDRLIDKIITNKITGIPIMLFLLFSILWITISVSNYPSSMLFNFFNFFEDKLFSFFQFIHIPEFINEMLVYGVYKTVTWVVSVMLPPMAIFFPLFTILEDYGFLPRIAFNMDRAFSKCNACGKQCLTMLMGFGCNAVGVTGTRIIDSKREKIIAILTNVFVPCNGRFPTIIAIISMFFVSATDSFISSFTSAFILTIFILLSILMTLVVSKILSKTLLKGYPSSFILELPPYRRPKFLSVIARSIFDRTLLVLGRAVVVSVPAGLILFLIANLNISEVSILEFLADKLDSTGSFIGLDGIIILAFILGFPANEIVVPVMLMGYLGTGSLTEYESLNSLKEILVNNGWTLLTAINFILLSLFHFPCSTTFLTIKKETGSLKWSLLSLLIPTIIGVSFCLVLKIIWQII